MKWMTTMVLVLALLLSSTSLAFATTNGPVVTIDGKDVIWSASSGKPFVDAKSRLQVPIRSLSDKLGMKVVWNDSTRTATINGSIKMTIGSNKIQYNGGTITMDTQAIVQNGRLYVPVRYVAQALGYTVNASYSNTTLTANLYTKPQEAVTLTVSAAASLKDVLAELKTLYEAAYPHVTLTFNMGPSGTLQQQIEQGADVDVFLSAGVSQMTALKDKGLLVDSTNRNLLRNTLTVIVPQGSGLTLDRFENLADSSVERIAVGEFASVPVGQYSRDVFNYLNIMDQVESKLVFAKDVREVLSWVETGNVNYGIVYMTDAMVSDKVRAIVVAPAASHKPIIYPVSVIKSSTHQREANAFETYLMGAEAKAIFSKYGFSVY